jgi:hypothetical protein
MSGGCFCILIICRLTSFCPNPPPPVHATIDPRFRDKCILHLTPVEGKHDHIKLLKQLGVGDFSSAAIEVKELWYFVHIKLYPHMWKERCGKYVLEGAPNGVASIFDGLTESDEAYCLAVLHIKSGEIFADITQSVEADKKHMEELKKAAEEREMEGDDGEHVIVTPPKKDRGRKKRKEMTDGTLVPSTDMSNFFKVYFGYLQQVCASRQGYRNDDRGIPTKTVDYTKNDANGWYKAVAQKMNQMMLGNNCGTAQVACTTACSNTVKRARIEDQKRKESNTFASLMKAMTDKTEWKFVDAEIVQV